MDLPPLVLFCGNWNRYIETIYKIYTDTILNSNITFKNIPVRPRYSPLEQGKEHGFWHVTSEGYIEEERQPDLRRCERIKWLEWVIRNFSGYDEISCWEEKRNNKKESKRNSNHTYSVIV